MKKIILLGMVVTLACLVIGGATFAYFADSVSSQNNVFTAGTIVLTQERDQADTIPGPMFYSADSDPSGLYPYDTDKNIGFQPPGGECLCGWAPGSQATRALNVYNKGTIDAKITKIRATVSGGEIDGPAFDEFVDKMNIKVLYPTSNKLLYEGKLSGLLNGWVVTENPIRLNANTGSANFTFEATMDTAAGNAIQGKTFVFDFELLAEQL